MVHIDPTEYIKGEFEKQNSFNEQQRLKNDEMVSQMHTLTVAITDLVHSVKHLTEQQEKVKEYRKDLIELINTTKANNSSMDKRVTLIEKDVQDIKEMKISINESIESLETNFSDNIKGIRENLQELQNAPCKKGWQITKNVLALILGSLIAYLVPIIGEALKG